MGLFPLFFCAFLNKVEDSVEADSEVPDRNFIGSFELRAAFVQKLRQGDLGRPENEEDCFGGFELFKVHGRIPLRRYLIQEELDMAVLRHETLDVGTACSDESFGNNARWVKDSGAPNVVAEVGLGYLRYLLAS